MRQPGSGTMALGHSPPRLHTVTIAPRLSLRNARAMGLADERVAVALDLTPTMLARIRALLASGNGRVVAQRHVPRVLHACAQLDLDTRSADRPARARTRSSLARRCVAQRPDDRRAA